MQQFWSWNENFSKKKNACARFDLRLHKIR